MAGLRFSSIHGTARRLSMAAAVLLVCTLYTKAFGAPLPDRTVLAREARPLVRPVFPGAEWQTQTPGQAGMDVAKLDALRDFLGGRGAIVRGGYLIYTWGDPAARGDVASAAKPMYTHFLLEAVENGLLSSVDAKVQARMPCVGSLNAELAYKDRAITFRHMANQVSCYGVSEQPGTAFDYNDWQVALFWDTLFLKVWNTTYTRVDEDVLGPELSSVLQFQDAPTFLAFGLQDRPGRLGISPRDFSRFGLLYLRRGLWNGIRVLSEEMALTAVTRELPLELPRTTAVESEMCPHPRTLGSTNVPDDQADHDGGYAWSWWVNGVTRSGIRTWPDAEGNVFAALGHDGRRGLAVLPCLDLVISWNDATERPMNDVFRRLYQAASTVPNAPPQQLGSVLRVNKEAGGGLRLVWSMDPGAPRASGEHYHVLRGTKPSALDLVPGTHPLGGMEFSETSVAAPLIFYRVVPASPCEQEADN